MGYEAPATYASLIAPRYVPIAEALLEAAAPRADDDVLELGAGTGLVTARVAPRVRSLVATDRSGGMLAVARESIPPRPSLTFALVDYAAPLPFLDDSFDLVLSGLTYVQDARGPVAEIARVLRPNGRVALAMWGNGYHELRLLSDALESIGLPRLPPPAPGRAVRRLAQAGFDGVDCVAIELVNEFGSVDEYLAYRRGFGIPLGWTRATYERYLRAIAREAASDADGDGGFALGWTVAIVTGRRR
jgi:ubiquinone/menaquinone biosynthesis C-methylase UbiE